MLQYKDTYALNKPSLTSSCEVEAPNRESLRKIGSIISVNVCHVLKNTVTNIGMKTLLL